MEKEKNKERIPQLRFPEFKNAPAWKQRKVGEIFTVTRGQVLSAMKVSEYKTADNIYPVYSSQTKNDGLMGYFNEYLFDTAITWTTDGANAGTVNFREGKFFSTNVNGVLLSNDGLANKAVSEIINKVAWKHVSKVGNPKLMNNVMSEIRIMIPTLAEQKAIGDFFQTLDRSIALHQRELENLKNRKKSLLQKMFPKNGESVPKIRFPEFKNAPAWEQRKLGEVAEFSKGNGYSKSDLIPTGTPIILYGRLYTNYETIIDKVDTYVSPKENSVVSQGNEVIVPASGETAEDISRASVVKNSGVILGGDLNIIKVNDLISTPFLAITISNGRQQKELSKRAQGKSVVHIRNSDLKQVDLMSPSLPEQKAIGDFFSTLDRSIALHQRE